MARAAAATRAPARRQPASRSRRRTTSAPRRSGGGIHWERVGRLALLGVLGIIVLLYIPPVTHWFQQRGTAARSEQQLRDPGALEREARELGMVRAGERAYVIEGLPR